jgi:hypothetical protein
VRVIVVIAGDAVPSVRLQAHNGSPEEIDEVLAGARCVLAIRICPLTATRLTLSLSQIVSGSRYRPPWFCYRSHHPWQATYRLRVRADAAGCGARQAGSMLRTTGALAIVSGICSSFSMPGSPGTHRSQNWPPSYQRGRRRADISLSVPGVVAWVGSPGPSCADQVTVGNLRWRRAAYSTTRSGYNNHLPPAGRVPPNRDSTRTTAFRYQT